MPPTACSVCSHVKLLYLKCENVDGACRSCCVLAHAAGACGARWCSANLLDAPLINLAVNDLNAAWFGLSPCPRCERMLPADSPHECA